MNPALNTAQIGGELAGRVALVTGGARGIGRATCRALAAEGATVLVADILHDDAAALTRELLEGGMTAYVVDLDVSRVDSWKRAADYIEGNFGKLNILVNNAGIVNRQSIMETVDADLHKTLDVNLIGPLLGIQMLAPLMRLQDGASIVNVSSTSGIFGQPDAPYSASKWALRGLAKTAAIEFADWGIRANSIHPGTVPTDGHNNAPPGHAEAWRHIVPMHRAGEPTEIARAILFLVSDRSSYVTGTELIVDGGLANGGVATARASFLALQDGRSEPVPDSTPATPFKRQ